MNINEKNNSLKNNSFTTPANMDEVSVNRIDYTDAHFVKRISKLISNPVRNYCGLAIIEVQEIRDSDADIEYSPMEVEHASGNFTNKFHSDIKIGYIKEVGKPLPARFAYKVEQMVEKSRYYHDQRPNNEFWEGDQLV